MNATRRPAVFSAGILLTAIATVCWICLGLLVGLFGLGAGGFALAQAESPLPIGLAFGAGAMLLTGWLLWQGFILFTCARAWNGSRGWTIVLLVLSVLGLMKLEPLSMAIQILTIVGASIALSQEDARPESQHAAS